MWINSTIHTVTHRCRSGYMLLGNSRRRCGDDNRWIEQTSLCIKNVLKGKHEHSESPTPIIKIEYDQNSTLNFDPVTIRVILLTTFPSKSDDFNLTRAYRQF
jgi:hypothetical protein